MARDLMLIEFLKKESATTSLIVLLAHFDICNHRTRPFRVDPKELWISNRDIKVFCERWVKTHREQ